ncbi:MAG: NADH-quinone oxidoreductase subunit N [Planctomycetes bacterium]|nr:NADH-quinone oxidoreductase subunit N [Planctomycetota bacterium]
MPISPQDFWCSSPILILCGFGTLLLIVDARCGKGPRDLLPIAGLSLFGLLAAGAAVLLLWGEFGSGGVAPVECFTPMGGMGAAIRCDGYVLVFDAVFLLAAGLTCLISLGYLERMDLRFGEFFALILFATAGMMLMASAMDLVVALLSLEVMSIALYILCGLARTDLRSNESALKYFIIGAFSSAVLVYGIALVYGATGSTALPDIARAASRIDFARGDLLLVGSALIVTALCFKIAAVPFHGWAPDAYEGAPTPVTAFMSTGVKAAAFAMFARIALSLFASYTIPATEVLWLIAMLTMIGGNLAAVVQTNVKRMLAYSSIAHAGYLLVGLVAAVDRRQTDGSVTVGTPDIAFYLIAYTLMTMGAFAVVVWFGRRRREYLLIEDFAGIGFRHPFIAIAFSIFLLSLAGIPPTAGFMAKFGLFRSAVATGHTDLAVIGVLTSVISVYYYLRLVVLMYMRETETGITPTYSPATTLAIVVSGYGVLHLGLFPGSLWRLAEIGAQTLAW